MALYYPQPNQKRPLILVGPPSIGRHELRQRLLDDTVKFAAPIPRKLTPSYNPLLILIANSNSDNFKPFIFATRDFPTLFCLQTLPDRRRVARLTEVTITSSLGVSSRVRPGEGGS